MILIIYLKIFIRSDNTFNLVLKFKPNGDQPWAIEKLVGRENETKC